MNDLLSIYIHIPFCLSKCSYCDFFSIPCKSIPENYLKALENELDYRINLYKKKHGESGVKSVYIGGGTPSLLNSTQLEFLHKILKKYIPDFSKIEFTFEVNPDDVCEELLINLEKLGVNRISCGIQSLNQKSLETVNRRASVLQNIQALECFKKFWKKTLSLDLIAGLPYENTQTFVNGIKKIIGFNPDHISLYTLTVEDNTVLFTQIENNEIEYDFDFNDELWLSGKEILENEGYKQYEVSNFSKKGFECKHNLTYWKHENYLGLGSGGTGTLYKENGIGFRWTNTSDINNYVDFWCSNNSDLSKNDVLSEKVQIVEIINKENSIFEFFMMGLRTRNGVNSKRFEYIFNEKMPEGFINQMIKWNKKNLAEINETENGINYSLNEKGLLFLNKFLEELNF